MRKITVKALIGVAVALLFTAVYLRTGDASVNSCPGPHSVFPGETSFATTGTDTFRASTVDTVIIDASVGIPAVHDSDADRVYARPGGAEKGGSNARRTESG